MPFPFVFPYSLKYSNSSTTTVEDILHNDEKSYRNCKNLFIIFCVICKTRVRQISNDNNKTNEQDPRILCASLFSLIVKNPSSRKYFLHRFGYALIQTLLSNSKFPQRRFAPNN
jgi:hypothetical protein